MMPILLVVFPALLLLVLIYALSFRTGPDQPSRKQYRKDF